MHPCLKFLRTGHIIHVSKLMLGFAAHNIHLNMANTLTTEKIVFKAKIPKCHRWWMNGCWVQTTIGLWCVLFVYVCMYVCVRGNYLCMHLKIVKQWASLFMQPKPPWSYLKEGVVNIIAATTTTVSFRAVVWQGVTIFLLKHIPKVQPYNDIVSNTLFSFWLEQKKKFLVFI